MTEAEAVAKYSSYMCTVGRVRKDITKYFAIDVDSFGEDRKRIMKVKTEGLDELILAFIKKGREHHLIIIGPIIQHAANSLAKKFLDIAEFKASNGWLEAFIQETKLSIMFLKVKED